MTSDEQERYLSALTQAICASDRDMRIFAALELGKVEPNSANIALPLLEKAAKDEDEMVRQTASEALEKIKLCIANEGRAMEKNSEGKLQPNQSIDIQKPAEVGAKSTGIDEKLKKLKELKDGGLITEIEYQTQRQKVLEDFRKTTPQYMHIQKSTDTPNASASAGSNKTSGTIIELIGIGIVVYFAFQLYKVMEGAKKLSQLVGEKAAYKLVEGKMSELAILVGVGIIVFIVGVVVYRK